MRFLKLFLFFVNYHCAGHFSCHPYSKTFVSHTCFVHALHQSAGTCLYLNLS